MATQIQPHHPQQSQREDLKREDVRREELEKMDLEEELREMDAHGFYERLKEWSSKKVPKPYYRSLGLALLQNRELLWHPLPITRSDEREVLFLSKNTGRILSLLRRVDQKGLECPYIHQLNKDILEAAIHKCTSLEESVAFYLQGKGFFARCSQILNRFHIFRSMKSLNTLKRRLEAIMIICRHQEFSNDLMHIRRSVTFRTGNVLKDDVPLVEGAISKRNRMSNNRAQYEAQTTDRLIKK